MIRILADENFSNYVLKSLRSDRADLDLVRVQDVGLAHTADPLILEWAAHEDRVLFTHDKKTMTAFANARVAAGEPMPGVCIIRRSAPRSLVIEDLRILLECTPAEAWANQVKYVPL